MPQTEQTANATLVESRGNIRLEGDISIKRHMERLLRAIEVKGGGFQGPAVVGELPCPTQQVST